MSDKEISEAFKEHREERRKKREQNRIKSTALLEKMGIKFTTHNNGAHLVIDHHGNFVDFWPGTGKYAFRAYKPVYKRGVKNLLNELMGVK